MARIVWKAVSFVLTVVSLTIAAYLVFSLFYSNDEEKALEAENELYARLYGSLPGKIDRIEQDVERLARKDDIIYKDIFHADPPSDDPMSSLEVFFGSDTIPDAKLVFYTARKADRLTVDAAAVDSLFRNMVDAMRDSSFIMPPMDLPLLGLNCMQVGAGVGQKINPFYTTSARHDGVDFIVPRGTPVYAPAAGVVSSVSRSRKGDGNTVSIRHKGGYVTRYAHLSDIYVSKGQSVRRGSLIAGTGMSGNAYAPHLHYELRRDSLVLDPLNFIFASVSPEEYSNMVYMAQHTEQSMD